MSENPMDGVAFPTAMGSRVWRGGAKRNDLFRVIRGGEVKPKIAGRIEWR